MGSIPIPVASHVDFGNGYGQDQDRERDIEKIHENMDTECWGSRTHAYLVQSGSYAADQAQMLLMAALWVNSKVL